LAAWQNDTMTGCTCSQRRSYGLAALTALPVLAPLAIAGAAAALRIDRVSIGSGGVEAAGDCTTPVLSSDGNILAFSSLASNLVAGDSNRQADVFVRDLNADTTTRVSVSSSGQEAAGGSWQPAMSADGRFIAFQSTAMNLVPGDNRPFMDVFVHDRLTGITDRASESSTGALGDNGAYDPVISADGRYVAFQSDASNLVAFDANGSSDVFLRDRTAGTTTRVSVNTAGQEGAGASWEPAISADGRWVAFTSNAANLVSGDSNAASDVFVHDSSTGVTTRASRSAAGAQANGSSSQPTLAATGRHLAFVSTAENLVPGDRNRKGDVFVADLWTGRMRLASVSASGIQANEYSREPRLSADGRFVAFASLAGNLVPHDDNGLLDVFVHDLLSQRTHRMSVAWNGAQSNSECERPTLSADGRTLAFVSQATNLVPGDANAAADVFRVR
jgi:Tol biopolymer transport system component